MTFRGNAPGEYMLTGATSSMVTDHNTYTKFRKAPQYGTCKDSYIEEPTTSYYASRY